MSSWGAQGVPHAAAGGARRPVPALPIQQAATYRIVLYTIRNSVASSLYQSPGDTLYLLYRAVSALY
eukprot:5142345-Prymnesium_polylepis.2